MENTFHSVGQNFFKLVSVLENGIVPQAYSYGITAYCRNFLGYNGASYISISRFGTQSFRIYSQKGFSLMINESIYGIDAKRTNHDSGIPGEAFVTGCIPVSKIDAVVCPEYLLDAQIRDLRLMQGIGTGLVDSVVQNIFKQIRLDENNEARLAIENLLQEKANLSSKEMDFWDRMNTEKMIIEEIDKFLAELIHRFFAEQFGKEDVSVRDMMQMIAEKYNIKVLSVNENNGFTTIFDNQPTSQPS